MRAIYFSARRRKRKSKFLFSLIPLFLLGLLLGFYYDSHSVLRHLSHQGFLQTQFYCGDLGDIQALALSLSQFPESEVDSSLNHWDISFYEDEATSEVIPVFVGTVDTGEGRATATTDLIRAPQSSLELTSLQSDSPQVLIYCTHTSEGYSGGGSVLDVAHALKSNLENNYGVGVVVSDKVHDSPDWSQSYATSRVTAKELLAAYSEAKIIIDLHRDSGPAKKDTTLTVNQVSMANVLLVVGSNLTMEHPNWQENLATANTFAGFINEVNGDILRGVRVQKGRYNQHLTKNAILLEVGTELNTLEEVTASTGIVAEALYRYLSEASGQG